MEKSKPRLATLFTIKPEEVVSGDFVELCRLGMNPIFVCGPTNCEAVAPLAERFAIPVNCIRRFQKPRTGPINIPWDEPIHEDCFISVEPALAEMLQAPYKAASDEHTKQCEALLAGVQRLHERFHALPWWGRIWVALKNERMVFSGVPRASF